MQPGNKSDIGNGYGEVQNLAMETLQVQDMQDIIIMQTNTFIEQTVQPENKSENKHYIYQELQQPISRGYKREIEQEL